MSKWQNIKTAPKDGTPIWAILRDDIYPTLHPRRGDLARWNGVQVPLLYRGAPPNAPDCDQAWKVALPVPHGGIPDEWIAGWRHLPAPPMGVTDVYSEGLI